MTANVDSTLARLEDQITWYDNKSSTNQLWYKSLKIIEIVAAALVPLAAGFALNAYLTGSLGVVIVVTEGLLQLNQHHHNWITYRSTCEALKHEKFLHLAQSGPYSGPERHRVLADRVESLVSREHTKWVSTQEQAAHTGPRPGQE